MAKNEITLHLSEKELHARIKAAILADAEKDLQSVMEQLDEHAREYAAAPFFTQYLEREKFREKQRNLVYLMGYIETKKNYVRNQK